MEIEITPAIAAEAIAVLENTEISLLAKIPMKLIIFLQDKADEGNARFSLDFNRPYEEQAISDEARAIITLIYKDYWCTPEERKALEEKMEADQIKLDEEIKEKYNPDKIFDKEETSKLSNNIPDLPKAMIEVQRLTWYSKIINKIKSFFTK